MAAEPLVDRVEPILQRDAFGLGERGDLGHQHRGGDAVLVERAAAHEVAERLLVAEHEPLTRAGSRTVWPIHLKPV